LLANGATGIAVGMATSIPPHNAGELCEALLHLIRHPEARAETLVEMVPGPDFPTGGVLVEPRETILAAYRTGKGGFRHRAVWTTEDLGRGTWQIVVTEIPYQVQKSKLIERIADLITTRKIPILGDVRDESAEDIRVVLEPKSRSVDPGVLMETLFRHSDLELRFPLNMNVLIDGRTPRVCGLREVLRAFLDHRREVLIRRSNHRVGKIGHRLEVLEGYIVAFLNLDRVIEIIRNEDEPKRALMAESWDGAFLTEVQAEAILNMRLRSLRRLEEIELRRERDNLIAELDDLTMLLGSQDLQWGRISDQIREIRDTFGAPRALRHLRLAEDIAEARAGTDHWPAGARRTGLADAPAFEEVPIDALVEREPITVVCSDQGWLRAMKGHVALDSDLKYKDGDSGKFLFHAETTDKILAFASNGRFYTLAADRLPGGRGMGEPIRLMVDLPNDETVLSLFVHRPGRRLLVASSAGDGFIVGENDVVAQTRTGRQVLNVRDDIRSVVCAEVAGDHIAVVGQNRKLLVFPISELPEMTRGKGVRLQKYKDKDGRLSDAVCFTAEDGLTWHDPAGRTRTERELGEWIGKRASAGRMAPRGFPQDNRFN
ncbi:MAG: DNA topoisomerase IV subunit A, partial [Pseudomonadota bacterium]